jgi:hypothetical protein
MASPFPLSLPSSVSIKKSRHLSAGADVSFDIKAQPGSDVLAALISNTPFPARRIDLFDISIGSTAERPVPFDGGKGTVTFSGKASGYHGAAVLDDPADVTALLVRDRIQDDVANGLALERKADSRFVLLRWGYDLEGAARGAVGLGVGAKATFGVEGKRLGAYAVVRQLPSDTGAVTALESVVQSWMLPTQFKQLDDLEPGTWIVAEVDGSFAMTLGAQYGYDFNWVREAVQLGGLSGDIGLKIQVGVSASFGFEASGQYAIALGRPGDTRQIRLQLFRLNRKGLNLAYSARASAQGSGGALLPDNFDEFVQGVFGINGLQVLKELDKWTAPDRKLSDLLAGVAVDYAEEFLGKVTGIDPKAEFESARGRLVDLLEAWHGLPHRVSTTVYSIVQKEISGVPELKTQLSKLATRDLDAFRPELEALLGNVDFFKTPFGKWLESAALTSVLAAASDRPEYERVQKVARQTLAILDGSLLEKTLVNLQRELAQRIGLDKIEHIVDQATFDNADAWLKARLSDFLGKRVDVQQVQEIRIAIHKLLALRQTFFAQARTALTKKYEFQLIGTYQKATTTTALVDVVFDFDASGAVPAQLTKLAIGAIDGDLDQILVQDIAGVTLKQGVLTHGVKRQTHLDVTMPFLHTQMDHINTSLAKVEAIQSERGRILMYDLHADDILTAKGKFSSRFTVHGQFAQQSSVRVFDDQSMTHSYTFRQAVPKMRRRALESQLKTYVDSFFPDTFAGGDASFGTWVTDLDRTLDAVLSNGSDNFGNTLLALELSAPSALVGAWALAPGDEKAAEYFLMSKAIQAQLRKLIPLCHFHDLATFKDRIPSAALLVYAALPPATRIRVERGHIEQFDDKKDVYWDIETAGNIEALVRHSLTVAALRTQLVVIHDTLLHADGMESVAADYHPDRIERVIANAVTTPVGSEGLRNLLIVERMVVREARQAGMDIAGFIAAKNSAEALKRLSGYGSKVTDAFNSTIGGLFSGRELRPLGTMVFLEAARAFAPELERGRPSAMLELTVLKEKPSFDMGSFVEGADIPPADIVRTEKFVALG